MNNIRNFVIIAHIDHGKSTLADRFLEITSTVESRRMKEQYLDQLELERERGITIKMAPVRMAYTLYSIPYTLNLIDTPGHPDFSYEVSRALAAVEGAILLVDATKGIQAQTLANFHIARKAGLKIIGAVNKIDMHPPQLPQVIKELADLIGCTPEEIHPLHTDSSMWGIHKISAKTGEGVEELLETVIRTIPSPQIKRTSQLFCSQHVGRDSNKLPKRTRGKPELTKGNSGGFPEKSEDNLSIAETAGEKRLTCSRALIFDSFYDDHKGIIVSVRIFNGEIKDDDEIYLIATNTHSKIKEIGYFSPQLKSTKKLTEGEIGYIATGIKDPEKIKIGDTIILNPKSLPCRQAGKILNPKRLALPGYKEPKPVVFVSFYPEENDDFENLKKALQKLKLNDSALKFEPDFNEVLGRGFKGGFLGKLHFEITAERLEKEFKIRTINSFPSVAYKLRDIFISNPKDLPDDFDEILEPIVKLEIIAPIVYLGGIFQLKEIFRMNDIQTKNQGNKVLITAKMPLAELISNFDDKLKSVSSGFASFSYESPTQSCVGDELIDYQKADLKKLEILVAGEPVAGLVRIFPKKNIESEARKIVERLKEILPRQQFSQAVQAVAGNRIIARETVPALKKDVAGYLYGGDRTRKMKLWKKQKKGKKKLRTMGRVRITAETFKKMIQ